MTISEAMRAVDNEYNQEILRSHNDREFGLLLEDCIKREYDEMDQALPGYVSEIAAGMGEKTGTRLPDYVYQMARMCFRMGMRVQRKFDHPERASSMFWRNDANGSIS